MACVQRCSSSCLVCFICSTIVRLPFMLELTGTSGWDGRWDGRAACQLHLSSVSYTHAAVETPHQNGPDTATCHMHVPVVPGRHSYSRSHLGLSLSNVHVPNPCCTCPARCVLTASSMIRRPPASACLVLLCRSVRWTCCPVLRRRSMYGGCLGSHQVRDTRDSCCGWHR